MPDGPAAVSQQAVQHTTSLGTASGSAAVRSVNNVHGLLSPDQKQSKHPSAAHTRSSMRRQATADQNASTSAGLSHKHHDIARERQQQGSPARPSSWDPLLHQHHAARLHPTAPSKDTEQQPAQPSRQQHHSQGPVRYITVGYAGYTHQHQNAPRQQHQQHKAPPQSPEGPHLMNGQARHKLDGVRQVKGGWEARIARQGYSKAKESLGIHCTGVSVYTPAQWCLLKVFAFNSMCHLLQVAACKHVAACQNRKHMLDVATPQRLD